MKNPPANAGDVREGGLIPGLGRSPGGEHDNPLQFSCLERTIDRGAWRATNHRITKSWTQLKRLSMHARVYGKMQESGLIEVIPLICTAASRASFLHLHTSNFLRAHCREWLQPEDW